MVEVGTRGGGSESYFGRGNHRQRHPQNEGMQWNDSIKRFFRFGWWIKEKSWNYTVDSALLVRGGIIRFLLSSRNGKSQKLTRIIVNSTWAFSMSKERLTIIIFQETNCFAT